MEGMTSITGAQYGFVARRILVDDQDSAVEMPPIGEPGPCLLGIAFYYNDGAEIKNPERTRLYRTDRRGRPCVIEPPKTSQMDWTNVVGGIVCDGKRCMKMSLADLSRSVRFIVNSKASEEVRLALMTGAVQPEPTLSLSEFLTSTESIEREDYSARPTRENSTIRRVRRFNTNDS